MLLGTDVELLSLSTTCLPLFNPIAFLSMRAMPVIDLSTQGKLSRKVSIQLHKRVHRWPFPSGQGQLIEQLTSSNRLIQFCTSMRQLCTIHCRDFLLNLPNAVLVSSFGPSAARILHACRRTTSCS